MATKALVLDTGTTQRVPDAETLIVGVGIDAATAGTLTIGGTTATSITLGSATIPVTIPGDVTTVGGTTFTTDATFEGNVTFGNAATDLVTFVSKVNSDIAFNGAGFRITNMLDPTGPSTQEGATAAWVTSQIAAIPAGVSSFQTSLSGLTPSTSTTGAVTLAGTLGVASGGTGAATLTGYVKGSGTAALTASSTIPGSDISGDISGNAANVTGVVAITNGGTGQTTASAAFGALSPLTTKGDVLGYGTGNARVPVGTNGQVLTADSTQALGVAWSTPAPGAVFAGALTVYVDPVNGTDAPGGGTLGKPYASINYAYSQVTSLGAPGNSSYNAQVGQFITEKLIFQLAPGRYVGDVTLGFKRARVQLVGDGVQIVGNVRMAAKLADFPASNLEAIKSSFPTPWTGISAQMTFELTGANGGGVEADTTADPFVITGLTSLLFDEPTVPGVIASGTAWENNFGQFNFYANKANLIGGMVYSTSYITTPFRGIGTNIIEVDSSTIGEAGLTRSYFGVVPYAYVVNPTTWNASIGVATGTQTSTTLQDTTKSWTVNQWAGATVTLVSGTGVGQTRTVLSNTANTLTVSSAWSPNPGNNVTTYTLLNVAGTATGAQSATTLQDTSKTWTVNQFAGMQVTLTGGTGAGQTALITSNTANTLTLSTSWVTTPVSASTTYNIGYNVAAGTVTLKAHNTTLASTLGPMLTIGEMDGCRIYDIDQTMLGNVVNGSVTGSISSSFLGSVVDQFRQYSGTGVIPSQYQIGATSGATRYKIDSTSYTTLAFNRSSSTGALTARTLTSPVVPGMATAGGTSTLTSSYAGWGTNAWAGGTITLTGGTGSGQTRTIASNTTTVITVSSAWTTLPALGTTYTITPLVSFDFQDDSRSLAYTPTTGAQWLDPDPATVGSALDKIAGTGLLAAAPTNGQIPIGNGTNFTPATLTQGSGITITNGAGTITIAATGGGTVTSVDVLGGTTGLTTSGGPITTSGAITLGGTLNVANGGTGVTSLGTGSIAALQVNVGSPGAFVVNGGALGTPSSGTLTNATGLPIDAGTTGTLPVNRGGSGATTLTGYVKGNGTSAFTASATIPGSDISGNISGNAANVTGTVAIANGGTGQTTASAAFDALSPLNTKGDLLGFTTTDVRIPVGSDGQVLVADSAQSAGVKWATPTAGTVTAVTASAPLVSSGGATPDISLTGTVPVANGGTGTSTAFTAGSIVFAGPSGVYAQDNANLFWNDSLNRLGIGVAAPTVALDVRGAVLAKNASDSTAAFAVQNAAGTTLIGVDTSGKNVYLGDATANSVTMESTNGKIVVDSDGSSIRGDGNPADGAYFFVSASSRSSSSSPGPASFEGVIGESVAGTYPSQFSVVSTNGSSYTNRFYVQGSNGRVGISTTAPTATLDVRGSVLARNQSNSTAAFDVQNAAGTSLLAVNTTDQRVGVGGVAGASLTHTFNVGSAGAANFAVAAGGRIHTYDGSAPTNGQILIGDGGGGNFAKATITAGSGVSITNGAGTITIAATGSGGTVTSVDVSGGTTGLTTSGGPVTGSGTITLAGTLNVANGGTGQTSLASGALVVGNGGSAVNTLSPGSNGEVLTVVGGAWTASSLPAATDYSVVGLATAQAANTAVTVAGSAAIATSEANARVAGIVKATNSVQVLGIVTCIVEAARAGQISQGEPVYLSASEAGKVTDVAPSTATQVVAELGIATAADASGTVTVLWQPKSIVVL